MSNWKEYLNKQLDEGVFRNNILYVWNTVKMPSGKVPIKDFIISFTKELTSAEQNIKNELHKLTQELDKGGIKYKVDGDILWIPMKKAIRAEVVLDKSHVGKYVGSENDVNNFVKSNKNITWKK